MIDKINLSEFLKNATDETTNLPKIPSVYELLLIRKGLRKKSLPDISLLPKDFDYEGVGKFQQQTIQHDIVFEWEVPNQETKICSFKSLCIETAHELNRLELGWMIADFAKLDAIKYLGQLRPIGYEDHHQNQFNKQYSNQAKHFQNIENEWRHWAIAPAGHMLLV